MKVGIVGMGAVGSSAAYGMVMGGAASELVLLDPDEGLAQAQAEDLEDAAPFGHPVRFTAGGYQDLQGAQAVVLCCGVRSRADESRLDLLARNAAIFRQVVPQVVAHAPEAILIVVSNPVDVLTDLVAQVAGLPPGRVFGTGTTLDTARFRTRLGTLLGVSPRSVHAYVLGEHGDSEVLVWSSAAVGGVPLKDFAAQAEVVLDAAFRARVDEGVRGAAGRIIRGKGATYYGIGGAISQIVRVLRDDERALLPLTAPSQELGRGRLVSLSLPRLLGAEGLLRTMVPALTGEEREALERSATILEEAGASIGL